MDSMLVNHGVISSEAALDNTGSGGAAEWGQALWRQEDTPRASPSMSMR